MNKLDKQFAEVMKDVRIDRPSSDFTFRVMGRIQAEAAVTRKPLLQDYQPVISKKTWIILLVAFVGLIIYISFSSGDVESSNNPGLWTAFKNSLSKINSGEASLLSHGLGLFSRIPAVAYLIILASLSLWTIDSFLNRFRNNTSKINIKQD